MRHRQFPEPPPSFVTSAAAETTRAVAWFTAPNWREQQQAKAFKFSAYGKPPVRQALNDAFDHCCAYCETNSSAGAGYDIEHYRPKGGFQQCEEDGTVSPGYFWLAACWENLLPSCQRCNRPERHKHAGEPEPRVSGKHNWFPLAAPETRMTGPTSPEGEEPLLLDPRRDDPHTHLEFVEEGLVRAREINGMISARGEATIRILGLNRERLVRDRRRKLLSLKRCLRRIDRYEGDPKREAEFAEALEELAELTEPDTPYLGLAEQFLAIRRDD
jgi:uncharacterized protein (TIGR02646 family)